MSDCAARVFEYTAERQFARVAKGGDLRSTEGNFAWVRTPQLTTPWDFEGPCRLVVRTSRCGRDNPGSTPGVDMLCRWREVPRKQRLGQKADRPAAGVERAELSCE